MVSWLGILMASPGEHILGYLHIQLIILKSMLQSNHFHHANNQISESFLQLFKIKAYTLVHNA